MTYRIQVRGRVQGVGFRPFVYNLALQYGVRGTVSNNEEGVLIHLNATKETAEAFLRDIAESAPRISRITHTSLEEANQQSFSSFQIVPSEAKTQISLPLTPDFAVCKDCKLEIEDPTNRRFDYPFTTCTNCGPRYSITTKFPFERAHTSMDAFQMCGSCQEEYENSLDRRFHSQTNSCADCGIQLKVADNEGQTVEERQEKILDEVASLILQGQIIALKNTNGYLLCCDATNAEVIHKLRARKKRPTKPFAVVFPSLDRVKTSFKVSEYEAQALTSEVAPIVILDNKKSVEIAVQAIAPKLNQTGVMLPHTTLLHLLLKRLDRPIVATSGNIHGFPIGSTEKDAQEKLSTAADCFVHHNLEINFPQDDSVLRFAEDKELIYRRSRGLAPNYIETNVYESLGEDTEKSIRVNQPPLSSPTTSSPEVLAMGAHLKSTFTFVPNTQTYVSQYFGNLDNYDVLKRYETTIEKYLDIFETTPKTILIDKHPSYQSSILGKELASKWEATCCEVQHHKAHFASVLGEHRLFGSQDKVLGVIWDGTGLGNDNQIWGGEFFTYQNQEITRLTHFAYYDWLAGDKMAKEPRLSLFSLLDAETAPLIKNKFTKTEWRIYTRFKPRNQLKTSSGGRLFDAAASALDLVDTNSFEAEAAMQLESCAKTYNESQPIDFLERQNYAEVPSQHIFKELFKASQKGISKERLAYSFIYTLAKSIIRVAKKNQIKTIACSGGVFQNALLVSVFSRLAETENLSLKLNQKLSPNDENISFGQLMYYQHIKTQKLCV
ncbi:MAG: carbamoyltransferase HypF [Bacteroidota bacterium]